MVFGYFVMCQAVNWLSVCQWTVSLSVGIYGNQVASVNFAHEDGERWVGLKADGKKLIPSSPQKVLTFHIAKRIPFSFPLSGRRICGLIIISTFITMAIASFPPMWPPKIILRPIWTYCLAEARKVAEMSALLTQCNGFPPPWMRRTENESWKAVSGQCWKC